MHTMLTIAAIFLGVFGFAFGLAGVVGMMRFDRKEGVGLVVADILACGVVTMLSDIAANWPHRPEPRRFVYIGLICSALCVVAIIAARRVEERTPMLEMYSRPVLPLDGGRQFNTSTAHR